MKITALLLVLLPLNIIIGCAHLPELNPVPDVVLEDYRKKDPRLEQAYMIFHPVPTKMKIQPSIKRTSGKSNKLGLEIMINVSWPW